MWQDILQAAVCVCVYSRKYIFLHVRQGSSERTSGVDQYVDLVKLLLLNKVRCRAAAQSTGSAREDRISLSPPGSRHGVFAFGDDQGPTYPVEDFYQKSPAA